MGFPVDRSELRNAGYTIIKPGTCKGCGAAIEWWRTTNSKVIPFDPIGEDLHANVTSHWSTCAKRDNFGQRAKATPPEAAKPVATKASTRQARFNRLRDELGANVAMLAVDHNGVFMAIWDETLTAEDLRHHLITAANQLARIASERQGGR